MRTENMIAVNHIPLFVEPMRFEAEKTAEVKLSDNVNKWDTEIIEHINEDVPFLAKVPFEIQLKQIDKELGYALGSVVIKIEGTQAAVPIIIKKRKLQSLDVLMIGDEEAMPLTEDNLLAITQKKQRTGKLTNVKNDGLVDRVTSNSSDESGHMPPNFGKYASLSKKHVDEFNEIILNEGILATIKIASASMSKKAATGFVKGFNKRNWQPVQKVSGITKVSGHVIKEVKTGLETLTKTGSALVVDIKNNLHKGLFINDIKTFDGEKVAQKLFIGDGVYSYQEKIAGKSGNFKVSGSNDYSIKDEIVFIVNGEATEPVKVASKLNGEKIVCANHLGRGFNVFLCDVKNITKTASGYLVPKNSTIIKLGQRVVARANDEALVKIASAKGNKTFVTCLPESNSFSNEKVGTFHNLSDYRMTQLMCGFYSNGVSLLEEAQKTGSAILSGVSIEQIKKASVPSVLSITESVKLAASLADPDSVDAILSLGFINEDNVAEFVEMVPQFEEVVNHLAKILISIRLGMAGDQNCVKHAMKYLQRTIDSLKALK